MKNKKSSMFLAGIMILLYHLWTNVSPWGSPFYEYEAFIKFIFFAGVDMFFFMSAFSLYKKNGDIKWHLKKSLFFYVEFVIFTLLYVFANKRDIKEIPLTLCFKNFFEKGGGSFLWFVPAIIITYLAFWLIRKADEKVLKKYSIVILAVFVIWLLASLVLTANEKAKAFFIYFSRIPILLIGYIFAKYDIMEKLRKSKALYFVLTAVLVIGGVFLIKAFGYRSKIQYPIYDFFYLTGIPLTIGLIMLCDMIPCGKIGGYIAGATLEMYGMQMAIGMLLTMKLFKLTQNIWATNFISVFTVIILSVIMNVIIRKIKGIKKKA